MPGNHFIGTQFFYFEVSVADLNYTGFILICLCISGVVASTSKLAVNSLLQQVERMRLWLIADITDPKKAIPNPT